MDDQKIESSSKSEGVKDGEGGCPAEMEPSAASTTPNPKASKVTAIIQTVDGPPTSEAACAVIKPGVAIKKDKMSTNSFSSNGNSN